MTPPCQSTGPAAQQWADDLAAWAIPEEILAAAPQSPYGFDVGMFARLADEALDRETPSQQVAREALSDGGSFLGVGCGGGAASLPLAPPATLIVGLDQGAGMLQAFAQRAAARGVVHETIEGAWPDVADQAPVVDVVVCHNVFYNVSDLPPFVQRLTEHARGRVVVQLTQHHPGRHPRQPAEHGGLDLPDDKHGNRDGRAPPGLRSRLPGAQGVRRSHRCLSEGVGLVACHQAAIERMQ